MTFLGKRLMVCLVLWASVSMAEAQQFADARAGVSFTIQPEAWQIVALANQARAAVGAGPLQWDPALAEAARRHCLRMAAEGPISHRYEGEPDVDARAEQTGAHFSLIEENVATGPTPAAIHDEWMHSSGHRTNLLNPAVDRVGVAVVASRGNLYAVADYERSVLSLTQVQVEAMIAGLVRDGGIPMIRDSADARAYCAQGKPDKTSGKIKTQAGFFMLWQGADLTRLPWQLTDRIATKRYSEASVGSCPTQNLEGSFTAYRIAVLLY
jgi:hypothetical protein